MPSFNLENELLRFKNAGFTVNFCDQAYVTDHYLDVGALVWYAKVLPWEFGNFTVESCLPQPDIDALCEKAGYIPKRAAPLHAHCPQQKAERTRGNHSA